ncbi:MAG: outer membrane protein, partial [Parvicellaceae bacterium]
SFSVLGRLDVNKGVLGGVAPMSNINLIARRIALNIQRIANGEDAEKINVKLPKKEELVINMATARAIDFSPSWEILAEAVLINETRNDISRSINIYDAIAEGLAQNLNIDIAKREVEITAEDVNVAKANLLPELKASASHTIFDDNTATISNGQNPENKGAAGIQLSQVIYSEQVTANKQIQELLLKASKAALETQSLDVVLDVSTTYLGLMQSKTAENIQKQNLEVTRKNLELARVSSSLGQSGPSDVYRWQGEIANAKSGLLNATAQRKQTEMALNQVLNKPINEQFLTQEIDINDSRLFLNNSAINKYVNNPRDFYQFADFAVERAKANTPDLKQFDYNVRAQERSLLLNQRNKYVPSVTLGGGYNYELYRSGAGTGFPLGFATPNDWNWNLQFGASLPIFQGGSRSAKVQQSKVQLGQLNTQRLNTERLIEQLVRSELENIRASFRNITLTKDAADAATKNFELIQDSYSKGAVTITQLLDAQNAAISAQLNSANAVYILLTDILNMERATGVYYMLMSEEQRTNYINQLESFFNR